MLLALAWIATVSVGGEDKDVFANWNQPGPPPLERFVEPLSLTTDQQQKLKPIFDSAQKQAAQDARRAANGDDRTGDQILNELVIRDADFRTRLAAVLSADQLARYEALTESRAPRTRTLAPHPAHGHGAMESGAGRTVPEKATP